MPRLVSDISAGNQVSRSMNEGQVVDSQTRVFRVLLNSAGEAFDIQQACGVKIGDAHPINTNVYCQSFDARFEGESRMVLLCTFNYSEWVTSSGQADPPQNPGDRPANWTTSTSLIEQPVYGWRRRTGATSWAGNTPSINSAGDHYDAVTQLTAMVNIRISQEEVNIDPLRHMQYVGFVNSVAINLGSLSMPPHTVMFRGVEAQPFVESFNGNTFRGWRATYDFAFKRNRTYISLASGARELVDLGWDIAVPQTGFNVKAFAPQGAGASQDPFGQPLMHGKRGEAFAGRIKEPLALPGGTVAGEKVRAMVKVFSYENEGTSQAPSASPIPLNDDGTPRKDTASPPILVYGYAVQEEADFITVLGLRTYP